MKTRVILFIGVIIIGAILLIIYPAEDKINSNYCESFSEVDCPGNCVVCPPCLECSSLSCQTEDFCESIGFDKGWYEGIKQRITNFKECISAGNPAMESYPRQCRDPVSRKTFIEEIDNGWRNDGIVLMQHETEGYFACFGCSTPSEGPAMCIDPIQEMKQVAETEERYCNENFELVENG